MKKKKISALFQIDPIRKLNKDTDSTISIIKEALDLGIEVSLCNPENIVFKNNKAKTFVHRIFDHSFKIIDSRLENLDLYDFFFIRQDPPINMNYLTNCYLLEIHDKLNKKPFFINSPSGIKNFTEKIFPLYFKEFIPETSISSNLETFESMLTKNQTLVVKTLYNKGGEGVFKVRQDSSAKAVFKKCTNNFKTPVVIQEFIEKVILGDKRIIIVNGEPIGAINRIPKKGNFKANLHLGGTAKKTDLTKIEREICCILRPILKKNGLFFVGIDVINEKLTEINVTSPTGINQIDSIYKTNLSKTIWKKLLSKI